MSVRKIVHIYLPWFDTNGELNYHSLTLGSESAIDRRLVCRVIRKWYKKALGVSMHKSTIEDLYKRRLETRGLSEQEINQKLHDLARRSYEETKENADTDVQDEAAGEAG